MAHQSPAPLADAVKAEWDALRAEIATRDAQSFQLMTAPISNRRFRFYCRFCLDSKDYCSANRLSFRKKMCPFQKDM